MRRLLAWFRPDPPRTVRVLFAGFEQAEKREGETYARFVERMVRPYLRPFGDAKWEQPRKPIDTGGCYDMGNEDERKEAA